MTTPKKDLTFRQLLPILAITFIDSMGFTIILPILPFYALAFGAPPSVIGFFAMSYALAQLLFAPTLGNLSDRFGRKPILTAAQIGTFASLLMMGFAPSLIFLFLARALDGITGANNSTVQSAISDMTSEEDRARGLGLVGAASGLGFVFGPILSGIALRLSGNNYAIPAFVAAGFSFLSILLTIALFRETLPANARKAPEKRTPIYTVLAEGLRSNLLRPLYGLAFAVQFIFGMFTSTFALFTLNRIGFNSANNAIFFGVFGVTLMVIQGVYIGRWVQRFGEYRVLLASFILSAVGFGIGAFTPQQAVPWFSKAAMIAELSQLTDAAAVAQQIALLPSEVGAGFIGLLFVAMGLFPGTLGYTLQLPAINTLITKRVASSEIGQALGVSTAFIGAGTVVGPLLGGWFFEQIGPSAPFVMISVLSTVVFLLLLSKKDFAATASDSDQLSITTQPLATASKPSR